MYISPCTLHSICNTAIYTMEKWLLIIGSLLFYAYGEPVYVLLMIGSSLVHYLLAMGISKSASAKKPLLALDVILSLVVLGLFKYTGMIVTTINQIAHSNYQYQLLLCLSAYLFLRSSLCLM